MGISRAAAGARGCRRTRLAPDRGNPSCPGFPWQGGLIQCKISRLARFHAPVVAPPSRLLRGSGFPFLQAKSKEERALQALSRHCKRVPPSRLSTCMAIRPPSGPSASRRTIDLQDPLGERSSSRKVRYTPCPVLGTPVTPEFGTASRVTITPHHPRTFSNNTSFSPSPSSPSLPHEAPRPAHSLLPICGCWRCTLILPSWDYPASVTLLTLVLIYYSSSGPLLLLPQALRRPLFLVDPVTCCLDC
jgi:hypothetical protein